MEILKIDTFLAGVLEAGFHAVKEGRNIWLFRRDDGQEF